MQGRASFPREKDLIWVRIYYDARRMPREQDVTLRVSNRGREFYALLEELYQRYDSFVVMLQDLIVPPESRRAMEKLIAETGSIVCAPVLLFPATTGLEGPVWEPRHILESSDQGPQKVAWISTGDRTCDLWGGSCFYLPREVWDQVKGRVIDLLKVTGRWMEDDRNIRDFEFWLAHFTYRMGLKARVCWEAQTVHVHY